MKKYLSDLQKYLDEIGTYSLTRSDEKMIKFEGIEKYIYIKLASSQFRSKKIPKKLNRFIRSVIKNSVELQQPIIISVPFGGYKKWQYPTAPHIDWAEVFNIRYFIDYLLPIISAYSPGVVLHYFSDEIFISRMNNIPQVDIDIYNQEFGQLCDLFNRNSPDNLQIKFSKIRDSIDQKTLLERFDVAIQKLKLEWEELDEEVKKYRLEKSARNYKGDLSKLNDLQRRKVLLESTLVHDAFIFGDWEEGVHWAFEANMIPAGFRYTGEWGIQIRSARGSAVQFWVGYGVVEVTEESKVIPRILTYQQFLDIRDKLTFHELTHGLGGLGVLKEVPILRL